MFYGQASWLETRTRCVQPFPFTSGSVLISAQAMFRFADADLRPVTKQLRAYEDELNRALKTSVPGLVSTTAEAQALAAAPVLGSSIGASDVTDRAASGSGTHRLLVPPDTFNVSILFAPTWSFLDRVRDVMPGGLADEDRGFGGFLDDFVQSIFLPQLEDRVASIFMGAIGAPDAFQEDFAARLAAGSSQPPVVKVRRSMLSTAITGVSEWAQVVNNLTQLIDNLCSMLRSTPFHRESYSRLILSVVEHFLQRCRERFHGASTNVAWGFRHCLTQNAQSLRCGKRSTPIRDRSLRWLNLRRSGRRDHRWLPYWSSYEERRCIKLSR